MITIMHNAYKYGRVWIPSLNHMGFPIFVEESCHDGIQKVEKIHTIINFHDVTLDSNDDFILMKYINLQNIGHINTYEVDICSSSFAKYDKNGGLEKIVEECIFEITNEFNADFFNKMGCRDLAPNIKRIIKVLGNKYENPELLERIYASDPNEIIRKFREKK